MMRSGAHDQRRRRLDSVSTPPADYPDDLPDYPPPGYGLGYAPRGFAPPPYGAAPPGYRPPPGYGTPTGYGPPPRYGPAPGYGPPRGYGPPPGYPPPGYGAPFHMGAAPPVPPAPLKPGIIPLRPLSLSDIFNGAVGYVRANPKPTLGLTAVIVVVVQVFALIAKLGPLASSYLAVGADTFVMWLGDILLSGILTAIVGRAVFGSTITLAEAWTKVRGRLLALIGFAALEAGGVMLLGFVGGLIFAVIKAVGSGAAFVFGLPLIVAVAAIIAYFYTLLSFAPVLIVLERLPVIDSITRSIALVRNDFWRVLGIRLLAAVVAVVVGYAVAAPLTLAGQLMVATHSSGPVLAGTTLTTVGSAIGQIITTPFSAGVDVLLYTDRRIRAEAFDLVLQSGAACAPQATASTDYLWLTRPV